MSGDVVTGPLLRCSGAMGACRRSSTFNDAALQNPVATYTLIDTISISSHFLSEEVILYRSIIGNDIPAEIVFMGKL